MTRRGARPRPIGVFAVEDTTVQVCWADLPPGPVTVTAGHRRVEVTWHGGPGGVVVDGLEPGLGVDVVVTADGVDVHRETTATLPALPGDPVARIAALNDVHLGCHWFSVAGMMREVLRSGDEISSVRCARSAVDALLEWGARRLVIKGDLVQDSTDHEWELAEKIFGGLPIPVDVALGNHEVLRSPRAVAVVDGLSRLGVELEGPVRVRELGGVRMVVADTAVHGIHHGHVDHIRAELLGAVDVDRPVVVFLHHSLEPSRITIRFPPSVAAAETHALLDAMEHLNPAVFVASGHTHRHRLHRRGSIPFVEVGSSKDYPGVWAGYEITTAGIRQVVRRITGDRCMDWTERTSKALGGFWGRWSPGVIEDRCFIHRWPV